VIVGELFTTGRVVEDENGERSTSKVVCEL
jgi:hypothetical protein